MLTSFFLITSLQVIKETFFELTAFRCFHVFCVSMLFKSLIKIKIQFESRLHYIDIIAYHRSTKNNRSCVESGATPPSPTPRIQRRSSAEMNLIQVFSRPGRI